MNQYRHVIVLAGDLRGGSRQPARELRRTGRRGFTAALLAPLRALPRALLGAAGDLGPGAPPRPRQAYYIIHYITNIR